MILRVTTIVDIVYPPDLGGWKLDMMSQGIDPESVLKKAARMGTAVHNNDKQILAQFTKEERDNSLQALIITNSAAKELGLKIDEREREVTYRSPDGVYVGHIDWLATAPDGQKWLIDLKTHGLWKYMLGERKFHSISSAKKAKVNLQTWLYKEADPTLKDYKRGVLVVNQHGWEFVELKRKPTKKTLAKARQAIKNYYEQTNF